MVVHLGLTFILVPRKAMTEWIMAFTKIDDRIFISAFVNRSEIDSRCYLFRKWPGLFR
jgi:hypothetical protein